MFDEQILTILQAAGIPAADAYTCVKAIKKKKADKVKAFRDRFEIGFKKKLIEDEGATEEDALKVVDKVWTIINDSASYLFCAAHALSMACDSLYAAWLKVHYPYELYTTLLKLYTEKGNKEKIAAISNEMDRYLGIKVTAGRFGQDNRDWNIDRENKTISQNLNSVKYISSRVADDMLKLSKRNYSTFVELLRDILLETPIDSRQVDVLIALDYFEQFGGSKKLNTICREFREGPHRITKTLKESTVAKRMEELKEIERKIPDEEMDLCVKLKAEHEYLGRCITCDSSVPSDEYFVDNIDSQYGVKVYLYSMQRGTTGMLKCTKALFANKPLLVGECIVLKKFEKRPRYSYTDGERHIIKGTEDIWIKDYDVLREVAA